MERFSRLAVSVGLILALLAVCLEIPGVTHATVALLLVLANVGLAKKWGRSEALAAGVVGLTGYYCCFLPLRGFAPSNPEQWIALAALLVTMVITGKMALTSERQRLQAVRRKDEVEKLYSLANALVESGDIRFVLPRLADRLAETFAAAGVALYDRHADLIVRAGPQGPAISDEALREAVTAEVSSRQPVPAFPIAPIYQCGETVGSFAMIGAQVSENLLSAIADRLGLGLARLYAIERSTEAEAIRRSEELKSAVLDAMAHEIRNPLNSVKLAATTLRSGRGKESARRELVAIICEEAEHMDRLIGDAVQLARSEASGVSLTKETSSMAVLIPAALQEMRSLAATRPIAMSVADSLPPVACDRILIGQVLRQLLSNALKYSPADSPLAVSAGQRDGSVVIDVVDRGPGVDEEEREMIFEKYYRGRAAAGDMPGTGLGLASARSIVRAHGGEIWVTDALGGGAAFHVSLPVSAASRGGSR